MPPEPSRLQRDLIHRLVEALRRDAVPPGTRLTEPGLARMLQVSRTPVRAVMEELARRGVLARREGGGYLLAALPPPEADGEPAEGRMRSSSSASASPRTGWRSACRPR